MRPFIPFLLFSSLYFFFIKAWRSALCYSVQTWASDWVTFLHPLRQIKLLGVPPRSASCSCLCSRPPVEKKFLAKTLLLFFFLHHFSKIFENPLGPAADLWLSFFFINETYDLICDSLWTAEFEVNVLQTKERNYLEMVLRRPFKPTETLWFVILGYINNLTRKFVDNTRKK